MYNAVVSLSEPIRQYAIQPQIPFRVGIHRVVDACCHWMLTQLTMNYPSLAFLKYNVYSFIQCGHNIQKPDRSDYEIMKTLGYKGKYTSQWLDT